MKAEALMKRYAMADHVENGAFAERHYAHSGPGRADSGSIYYYVAPGEATRFHRIDCDEYWCYAAGAPLEVWLAEEGGALRVEKLGIEEGCEPLVYVKRGTVFAARSPAGAQDGTFLTCITVPRFCYEGFVLLSKEEMLEKFPETAEFYR